MSTIRKRLDQIPLVSEERAREIAAIPDEAIDCSDIPELDEEFFKHAKLIWPPKKQAISLRVDDDVLSWFKKAGKGYQSLMNAVLRTYMVGHKDPRS